ncbi:hypothetical protein [Frankia sp. Cj3]|uniref:hypothetical protein n=1 Tax=Frankia sp. Cj3 TaxID=2880976 RepID=UPI001EF70394|nr:hypothetical protein [Frankia sp. Cj3]
MSDVVEVASVQPIDAGVEDGAEVGFAERRGVDAGVHGGCPADGAISAGVVRSPVSGCGDGTEGQDDGRVGGFCGSVVEVDGAGQGGGDVDEVVEAGAGGEGEFVESPVGAADGDEASAVERVAPGAVVGGFPDRATL